MSNYSKPDPITGTVKRPLGPVLLGGVPLFGIFAIVALFLPFYSQTYLYIALALWFLGVVALVWINTKPNLWAKLLYYVSLTGLFTVIAVRVFNHLFVNLHGYMGYFVILTVLFFHTLPLWNTEATRFLRGELSVRPQTWLGKLTLKVSLAIMPVAGLIGALIGLLTNSNAGSVDVKLLVLAPLCWYLALILPFSTNHPISPWEYNRLKKQDS